MKSEIKQELNKLVVLTLDGEFRDFAPTAREIYYKIERINPKVVRRGFKSFVSIMNTFKEVRPIRKKGEADTYTLCN